MSPAFQFYAQDFLTGVMYLTNEEIGIYIKLLSKQWTDGKIPKKRLGLFLGIEWDNLSEELKEKFTDFGEYVLNERMEKEREKQQNFKQKQALNGRKGGRPTKNKNSETIINTDEKTQTKPKQNQNINPNKTQKKPLEDEDRNMKIENEDEKKEKESVREKTIFPTLEEFLQYAYELIQKNNLSDFENWKMTFEAKYNAWYENDWKDGHNNKIKNWKTKLQNTLPYLKPINNGNNNGTSAGIPLKQATYDMSAAVERLTKRAENGDLPGVYQGGSGGG